MAVAPAAGGADRQHRHLRPRDRPRPRGAAGLRRPRDRDATHRHWSVSVEQAHSPDEIEAAFAAGSGWDLAAPLVRFFEHWPRVIPSAAQRGKLLNGQAVPLPVVGTAAGRATHALAVDRLGAPIAVLIPEAGWPERWRPTKVLIGHG